MPVIQTGQNRGQQRLQDLLLSDAAQEPQRHAPQILIGMLQVVSQLLAYENLQTAADTMVCKRGKNCLYSG